jgi:prepilin-type N-terminal cleavage/methylation domain-containing protein
MNPSQKPSSADFQSAVSQNCILRTAEMRRTIGKFRRPADYKSAIRQSATLRYFRRGCAALWTSRPGLCRSRKAERAFSLIEMIGVLAVIAILAAVMVPSLIRQMDRIAGEQESAALRSLSDALQQRILRNRYIPSSTDWATNIATELGAEVANVTTNSRRQPRFFLIDPALRIGNNNNSSGLPYTQANWLTTNLFGSLCTNNGALVPALSPRLLIVSSIGRALPTNIVSGVVSNNNFSAIWDRNDTGNTLPATSFTWTGWPNGDDLKVQRVNLSPLFVRLILTSITNVSESAYYSIDTTSTNYIVYPAQGSSQGRDGYFIKNSVLYLYRGRTNIDSQQILSSDTSFVYEQNVWRRSLSGGSFLAGSLDLGSIVDKYLEAPENTNAFYTLTNNGHGNTNSMTQQSVVVSNMVAFMSAYTNWAARYAGQSSWPHDSYWSAADSFQQSMVTAVQGQYLKNDYTPYPTACPP